MTALPAAMRRLLDSPLVAAASWLDRPAVVGGERDWTWRQIHTASIALADRLDGAVLVGNLCNSRAGFPRCAGACATAVLKACRFTSLMNWFLLSKKPAMRKCS